MTNAEARFNKSLHPQKPEGSLGWTAQDVHLDSHTAPELWQQGLDNSSYIKHFLYNCPHCSHQHKQNQNHLNWGATIIFTQGADASLVYMHASVLCYFHNLIYPNFSEVCINSVSGQICGMWRWGASLQWCNQLQQTLEEGWWKARLRVWFS